MSASASKAHIPTYFADVSQGPEPGICKSVLPKTSPAPNKQGARLATFHIGNNRKNWTKETVAAASAARIATILIIQLRSNATTRVCARSAKVAVPGSVRILRSPRNVPTASKNCRFAGSSAMIVWFLVSSGTNFALEIPAAIFCPWLNGTRRSPRPCKTSVGALTDGSRSTTFVSAITCNSRSATSGDVAIRCN
jgi:hypothetical protein